MDIESTSKNTQEQIQKEIERDRLQKEIADDLNTNPRYKVFFDKYDSVSVKTFIEFYSSNKNTWLEFGELYRNIEEERLLKYSEIAKERLWDIQHKKLFNLQCEWRAGLVKIPEIKSTWDFRYWEYAIRHCPFLPPISEEEYKLYYSFMQTKEFEIEAYYPNGFHDFEDFIKAHKDPDCGEEIPAWYLYYDKQMGTGYLLDLQDIKREKEEFYMDLWRNDDREKNPEKFVQPPRDNRPSINYSDAKVMDDFVNQFEEAKVKRYYYAMQKEKEINDDEDPIWKALNILMNAGDIEMIYNGDWRESVFATAKNYEKQQVINAFSSAYKGYLTRIKMGLPFEEDEKDIEHWKKISEHHNSLILQGRVINNEPADFEF